MTYHHITSMTGRQFTFHRHSLDPLKYIFTSTIAMSGYGHRSHVTTQAIRGCGYGGHASCRVLDPAIFGGTEGIKSHFRTHRLLARSRSFICDNVHPESPWTKDASRHIDPFASERALTCSVHRKTQMHTDVHTQTHIHKRMQKHADTDACMQTHARRRRCTHADADITKYSGGDKRMQMHVDTRRQMQMQADTNVVRRMQNELRSVCGWTQCSMFVQVLSECTIG